MVYVTGKLNVTISQKKHKITQIVWRQDIMWVGQPQMENAKQGQDSPTEPMKATKQSFF